MSEFTYYFIFEAENRRYVDKCNGGSSTASNLTKKVKKRWNTNLLYNLKEIKIFIEKKVKDFVNFNKFM